MKVYHYYDEYLGVWIVTAKHFGTIAECIHNSTLYKLEKATELKDITENFCIAYDIDGQWLGDNSILKEHVKEKA